MLFPWAHMSNVPTQPVELLLLVDDDLDAIEVLADALEAEGYHVRVAHNGKEGLDILNHVRPDTVVLDVEMPLLSGPEMALQMFLLDLGREQILILLCSGVLDLGVVAAQVGTPYYLSKSYTLASMLNMLVHVLAERKPPTPHRSPRDVP